MLTGQNRGIGRLAGALALAGLALPAAIAAAEGPALEPEWRDLFAKNAERLFKGKPPN
jgi:hypothetical protein